MKFAVYFLFITVRVISIGHQILLKEHAEVTLTCQYGISIDSQQRKGGKENKRNIEYNLKRKWFKGSRDLASRKERYLIQNVRPSDTGNYTCMVLSGDKDHQHKEIITYQLIVLGKWNYMALFDGTLSMIA